MTDDEKVVREMRADLKGWKVRLRTIMEALDAEDNGMWVDVLETMFDRYSNEGRRGRERLIALAAVVAMTEVSLVAAEAALEAKS